MADIPYLVAIVASNKPTAAQNYEHGTTPVTGARAPQTLVDGRLYVVHAFGPDANGNPDGNYEISVCTWNDAATDNFSGREIIASSNSNAAVDWSTATGLDIAPVIRVVCPKETEGRRLHSAGSFSSDASILIGGSSIPFREGYDYEIDLENVVPSAANGFLQMRWYIGSSVDSTSTDHGEHVAGAAGTSGVSDNNGADTLHFFHPSNTGLFAEAFSSRIKLSNPAAGGILRVSAETYTRFSGSRANWRMTGSKAPAQSAALGVQLFISNADLQSGAYTVWEIPR